MKKVLFRVDASASIGLGHLMRCLALAQEFAAREITSTFITNSDAIRALQSRLDWTGDVIECRPNLSVEEEIGLFTRICNKDKIKLAVIDGYHFSQEYRTQLKAQGVTVICFDDSNSDNHAPPALAADIIVNGAAKATRVNYAKYNPDSTLCVGDKYRVLRKEFSNLTPVPMNERTKLTISMGGSDPLDFSRALLETLEHRKVAEQITLITGAAYPHLDWLQRFKQSTQLDLIHLHDCQTIADVFSQSRWVISAAGGSQFELQSCGTPCELLVVADNQIGATEAAVQQGWCQMLNCIKSNDDKANGDNANDDAAHDEANKKSIAEKAIQRMTDALDEPKRLEAMHKKALQTADSQGAERLVDKVLEIVGID